MHLRLTSLAVCSFSLSLLLCACGGKTFESESDTSGVQGAGADAGSGGPSGANDEPSTAGDDPTEPTTDDTGGMQPVEPDPTTTPAPNPEQPVEPGPNECPNACPVFALCELCADGSCGVPNISCNPDGSCGQTTFVCPEDDAEPGPNDPGPSEPGPTEPVEPVDPADYQPCLDKVCGDECDACAPGLQCLIGAGYCDVEGSCLPAKPECGAEPGEPVEPSPGCNCPMTNVCMLCDDGSCASASPECDAEGACVGTQWSCPDEPVAECKTEKDCASLEGCLQCDNGAEWCPHSVCRQGECGTSPNLCPESYDPCEGKEEGEACQNCSPLDPACSETDEIKSCQGGSCMSGGPR